MHAEHRMTGERWWPLLGQWREGDEQHVPRGLHVRALIAAVNYPLPEKICEQVRDEWAKLYDDYTFACEEHAVRPKVQVSISERKRLASDCQTL
ncbi:hypothetical protein [Bradyrhizobium sp. 172]|uniref:hypothetical protein n=1 Tax=Bradyrhizobium sp. 172 TaxID=2782643 RepID=UPI001FFFB263|nr:hypothetical protein [Bradyrhizobium sp. 172]UPJ97415.1 hypothetical protein IVB07_07745 [Bradyrhizobium sp. 172]